MKKKTGVMAMLVVVLSFLSFITNDYVYASEDTTVTEYEVLIGTSGEGEVYNGMTLLPGDVKNIRLLPKMEKDTSGMRDLKIRYKVSIETELEEGIDILVKSENSEEKSLDELGGELVTEFKDYGALGDEYLDLTVSVGAGLTNEVQGKDVVIKIKTEVNEVEKPKVVEPKVEEPKEVKFEQTGAVIGWSAVLLGLGAIGVGNKMRKNKGE